MKEFALYIPCASSISLAAALDAAAHYACDHPGEVDDMRVDDSVSIPVPNHPFAVELTRAE